MYLLCAVLLTTTVVSGFSDIHSGQEHTEHFKNEWIAHIEAEEDEVKDIARNLGYQYLGAVEGFDKIYHFKRDDHPSKSKRHAPEHTDVLSNHEKIVWAEQLFVKKRVKRDFQPQEQPLNRVKRGLPINPDMMTFNDPLWPQQWYLHDTRTDTDLPLLDLQVQPVWKKGYTGKGVTVTVLDDGLQHEHPDLKANYKASISHDVNDNDGDPDARYDYALTNAHGTRCAGEIAMVANNKHCGVGVAYESSIGGIRMLDGPVTDLSESKALGFNLKEVMIMSASWGPSDDGKTVERPGKLAEAAIERGIKEGRGGKGLIYVWASGNGGTKGDDCDCDGYSSSIYTLAIGSASQQGEFPWYGEKCGSTTAVTDSSGAYLDQKISTTDLMKDVNEYLSACTSSHTGTSASAPLAAGIIALTLQANPELTWRDVQYLTVFGSEYEPLKRNDEWCQNNAGLRFNPRFGFGIMNASRIVDLAETWTNVPEKYTCSAKEPSTRSIRSISPGIDQVVKVNTDGCVDDNKKQGVKYLEHVECVTTISYSNRGSLEIFLISPSGTTTRLLGRRERDTSSQGFNNWSFTSVHTWSEDPAGEWSVVVRDATPGNNQGIVKSVELRLHGTYEKPAILNKPRTYRSKLNEDKNCRLKPIQKG